MAVEFYFFEGLVDLYFGSTLTKYGYSYLGNKESPRDLYCYFKRSDRLLKFHYSRAHDYIDIIFYKETDVSKLLGADHIHLEHIMIDNKYDVMVYKEIMPSRISTHESMQRLLELLNKHATEYLDGSKWKSWKEIMNWP